MSSASFVRLATVTASTKRPTAVASLKRSGTPATQIASLSCTPLDPLTADIAAGLGIADPHELLHTFVDDGLDIVEGDLLVVATKEYPIKYVGDWPWRTTTYRMLILKQPKPAS